MAKLDPRQLRDAFGSFMTGVTVVTTKDAHGEPIGFTANSFSSVSLEPPLLLVCPAKTLSSFASFVDGECFAINVLASDQQDISNTFASHHEDRFAQVDWEEDVNRCPKISGALTHFACRRFKVHEAGDHAILIGEVVDFSTINGQGLGYSRGGYFNLEMERAAQRTQIEHSETSVGVLLRQGTKLLFTEQDGQISLPSLQLLEEGDSVDVLKQHLMQNHAAEVRVGMVYSVFDSDDRGSTIYYRASLNDSAEPTGLRGIELTQLEQSNFASPAERAMVLRYVSENQTGNHKLYVGDQTRGRVHRVTGEE